MSSVSELCLTLLTCVCVLVCVLCPASLGGCEIKMLGGGISSQSDAAFDWLVKDEL